MSDENNNAKQLAEGNTGNKLFITGDKQPKRTSIDRCTNTCRRQGSLLLATTF